MNKSITVASICLNVVLVCGVGWLWTTIRHDRQKPNAEAEARTLLAELRSHPEDSVLESLRQLGQHDDVIKDVAQGLLSDDPVVFHHAMQLLRFFHNYTCEEDLRMSDWGETVHRVVFPNLLEAAKSDDSRIRRDAIVALANPEFSPATLFNDNPSHVTAFAAFKERLGDSDERIRQLAIQEIVSRYSVHLTEEDLNTDNAAARSAFIEALVKRHSSDEIPDWWWGAMKDSTCGVLVWNAAGAIATKRLGKAIDELEMIKALDESSRRQARDKIISKFWEARKLFYQQSGGLGEIAAGENPRIHGGYEWWETDVGQIKIVSALLKRHGDGEVSSMDNAGTWASIIVLDHLLNRVTDRTAKQRISDILRQYSSSDTEFLREAATQGIARFSPHVRPLDLEDIGDPAAEVGNESGRQRTDEVPKNATGPAISLPPSAHPGL